MTMIFATIITILNLYLYNLTKQKYQDTLTQLWKWESYIKKWIYEEIRNAPCSEIS